MDINNIIEVEDIRAYGEDIDNGIIRPEDVGYNDVVSGLECSMEDIDGDVMEELEVFRCLYL